MRRPRTLRTRLSLGIAVLVLAVLAVVGIVVYYGTAQRLTATLDASLRTATAQAMAGTNNQNGRLTLGPQLDEGIGADDLRPPVSALPCSVPREGCCGSSARTTSRSRGPPRWQRRGAA